MPQSVLITGATGFVGSHLTEACVERGMPVRALARPSSDTKNLERMGVTIIPGDVTDPATVRRAVHEVDVIVHCAAKVGDWGPVEDYRAVNVEGLRLLLDACKGTMLQRFVHLSSLGVYAARDHYGTDETEPLPDRHMDGYTQSKVEAERLALRYYRGFEVPVVVLRPGFVYGPRDRTLLPKVIENLRRRTLRWVAGGKGALNAIFVQNLVDAIFLAINNPASVGQVYNLTDGERITKRRFIETLVEGLDLPQPPKIGGPLWVARMVASGMEGFARLRGAKEAPRVTQARLKFVGLNLDFSIEKAKRELGYKPRVDFDEGMRQTIAWFRQNG